MAALVVYIGEGAYVEALLELLTAAAVFILLEVYELASGAEKAGWLVSVCLCEAGGAGGGWY